MFISYQAVRNTFIASVLAISAGFVYMINRPALQETSGGGNSSVAQPLLASQNPQPSTRPVDIATTSEDKPTTTIPIVAPAPDTTRIPVGESMPTQATMPLVNKQAGFDTLSHDVSKPAANMSTKSDEQLLQAAMQIASAPALKKGTDVLGPQSRWKLNLYDDNADGVWDRGKLDTDRDDQDDEKWNYKRGRWEKDGGAAVWDGSKWKSEATSKQVGSSELVSPNSFDPAAQPNPTNVPASPKSDDSRPVANSNLPRYREAMRVANAPAAKGKGKDVLGPGSPWKLNLYDDDNDGRWDRGKLDYNRDDIDDEKWNFKQGRWENDAGSQIWDGSNWKKP